MAFPRRMVPIPVLQVPFSLISVFAYSLKIPERFFTRHARAFEGIGNRTFMHPKLRAKFSKPNIRTHLDLCRQRCRIDFAITLRAWLRALQFLCTKS